MTDFRTDQRLKIYTTCPPSALSNSIGALDRLRDVARWSDEAGCEGILVFSDNRQLDPWLVAQVVIDSTESLCPLVAVQPVYMHPFTVAKKIASFAFLYGRRVDLNMVAGGFKNDLIALNDTTPHDDRYERLFEYTSTIMHLLESQEPFRFEGRYYKVRNLNLSPAMPPSLLPEVMVSGSSPAGRKVARDLGATAVEYPKPSDECVAAANAPGESAGIRIGLIARNTATLAWDVAHKRFPEDRKGQIARKLADKVSDSQWHKQLSGGRTSDSSRREPYWLGPFQNYNAMCPYLVGSYGVLADEIARYVRNGYTTFILDEPVSGEDMGHIRVVFDQVQKRVAAA